MQINIAIIEDEQAFKENLCEHLQQWAAKQKCLLHFNTYTSGAPFLMDLESGADFDVAFIDVMLPDSFNGIEIAKRVRQQNDQLPLIFVTSFVDGIGEGYRVAAMQYLIKPAAYEDVAICMDKVLSNCESYKMSMYLLQKNKNSVLRIPYRNILYFSSSLQYTEIHTTQGIERQLTRLKDIESTLPAQFVRCHRSYIVNLGAICSITPNEIQFSDESSVPISKTYFEDVKNKFFSYYQQGVL